MEAGHSHCFQSWRSGVAPVDISEFWVEVRYKEGWPNLLATQLPFHDSAKTFTLLQLNTLALSSVMDAFVIIVASPIPTEQSEVPQDFEGTNQPAGGGNGCVLL